MDAARLAGHTRLERLERLTARAYRLTETTPLYSKQAARARRHDWLTRLRRAERLLKSAYQEYHS
jgi:hypothetical protein